METIFIYFIKSSCLIAIFFLAYFLLLRKETFFTANRWFLLAGLVISAVLPLFFIRKIVYVEPTIISLNDVIHSQPTAAITPQITEQPIEINWFQIGFWVYGIVAMVLMAKVIYNCISLYKTLQKKQIQKEQNFLLVDVEEDVAPFSFFNYIVYNSNLYSGTELQSIISHEKIHSAQKHSIDVLITTVFSIVFWFNPFLYLYKKAIIQNLEFIADHDAIESVQDKKSYQMTLLKVVCPQNYSSITNHFNHSLIKKRIIMLNQNQSRTRNSWKYSVVIPALIAFVILFQIKTIAQVKFNQNSPLADESSIASILSVDEPVIVSDNPTSSDLGYIFDKVSSDNEMKENAESLKEDLNIDLVFSNVKRNKKGEIIGIKIAFNNNKGKKGETEQYREIPIRPIFFRTIPSADGKYDIGFYDNHDMVDQPEDIAVENTIATIESIDDSMLIFVDGEQYSKKDLEYIDPKSLTKIQILKDESAVSQYGAKAKNGVVLVTTNWTTNQTASPEIQNKKPVIFSNDNGDSVMYDAEKNFIKLPSYPSIILKDNYPVLIINGTEKSNPLVTMQKTDVTKIKSIRVYDANGKETPGSAVAKIVITTK